MPKFHYSPVTGGCEYCTAVHGQCPYADTAAPEGTTLQACVAERRGFYSPEVARERRRSQKRAW